MASRRFKDKLVQGAYDAYSTRPLPRGAGGMAHAYWNGREGLRPPMRNSIAYGAYAAGVDARRAEKR